MIEPDRTSYSPFFNSYPPSGLGVVIHATRSGIPQNPNELAATLNWFQNPAGQVSAHWVIDRDGTKVRVIDDDRQAWHARDHNATHWGIELCQGVDSDGYTQVQLDALAEVCKGYAQDFGVAAAHAFAGFVGHQETPCGRQDGKTDPGAYFPWGSFSQNAVLSYFLVGDEYAGLEKRGRQLFVWNEYIETDAIGDYDGTFVGSHWHNQGGVWVQILP